MSTGVYSKVTRKKIKRASVDSCRAFIPNERFLTRPRDFSVSIVFPLASFSFSARTLRSPLTLPPPPLPTIIERGLKGRGKGTVWEETGAMLILRSCLTTRKLAVSVLV